MIWSISLNIPGCCWPPPREQSLCQGEGVRWAEGGTEAASGGTIAGNASALLVLLQKMRVYLGGSCWQRWGCCCQRRWVRTVAAISSVPTRSCFLNVVGGVSLLNLLLQSHHPLPGLHTRAGSLSCTVAQWSLGPTGSNYSWTSTERGGGLGKVWISSHNRSPPGSCLDPLVPSVCLVSGCCAPLGWRSCQSSPFLMMDWNAQPPPSVVVCICLPWTGSSSAREMQLPQIPHPLVRTHPGWVEPPGTRGKGGVLAAHRRRKWTDVYLGLQLQHDPSSTVVKSFLLL